MKIAKHISPIIFLITLVNVIYCQNVTKNERINDNITSSRVLNSDKIIVFLNISEFEGNFDIERFKHEVVDNLNSKKRFSYSVYDCKKGCFTETVQIEPFSPIIIEGAYSLCKKLGTYADIKIFFDISANLQKKRIAIRNGEKALNSFLTLWIPAEERYFAHYNIQKYCDYLITEE